MTNSLCKQKRNWLNYFIIEVGLGLEVSLIKSFHGESGSWVDKKITLFFTRFFSIPYSLSTAIISISLSLHLVLLAPGNSCELHNYYLVLSFLFMYSSSGLSTDVFFLIK